MLATVLAGQDRYDEAIKLAREACQWRLLGAPSSTGRVLAGVLAEAGCLDEALRVAEAKQRTLHRRTQGAHGALGTVYVKMNDGESALAAFERMAECLAPETDRLPSSPWVSCIAGRVAPHYQLRREKPNGAGRAAVHNVTPPRSTAPVRTAGCGPPNR